MYTGLGRMFVSNEFHKVRETNELMKYVVHTLSLFLCNRSSHILQKGGI